MSSKAPYQAAWADTNIHDFLMEIEQPSPDMAYALITCLDSSVGVPILLKTSPMLRRFAGEFKPVGKGAFCATRWLINNERVNRIFFGFDEVWFFQNRIVKSKPESVTIVGPGTIKIERMGELVE